MNTMIIRDGITGREVTLFFHAPTTQEWVDYETASFQRDEKGKVKNNSSAAKIEAALKLIDGVSEGFLTDPNGEAVSSDPGSANFRENWKDILKETKINILAVFGTQIFQTTLVVENDGENRPF